MGLMAADTPLDADVLHQKARDETGLDDFGNDDYRERFDLFLGALARDRRPARARASSASTCSCSRC